MARKTTRAASRRGRVALLLTRRLRRRVRIGAALVGAAAAALALPAAAGAHVANIEYRFPLPVWVYALAGAVAVLATVPAAALAVRARPDRASGNLYPSLARLHLGAIGLALATILLAVFFVSGFFNSDLGFFNPASVLFWVDFWVGLGILSALVGNVWDFVSPLSAAGRWLERLLAARGASVRAYPPGLGVWPSVVLLLVFSWVELVWDDGRRPETIAMLAVAYVTFQLAGMVLYGVEVWLARGELFTVFARTFARLAPLELYVTQSADVCRAARCEDEGERIGCPSCWIDAPRERRGLRLRAYGAGIRREPPLGPGGSAFVVFLLATVVFDGFRGTVYSARLDGFFVDLAPGFRSHDDILATYTMIIILAAFALLFLAIVFLVSRLERVDLATATRRYAPTLIPIAAVYFIAHYILYLFYTGQLTPGAVLDPLGRDWVGDYRPWTGVPGSVVWIVQAGFIVWGHVVAVVEAHRVSIRVHTRVRHAVAAQLPLAALMVTYTFAGLWVLGQALRGEG